MRYCIYGGSNSGKSVLAAFLFHELRLKHHSVELITEAIKPLAYAKLFPQHYDQFYLFSEQLRREELFLRHGVKNIITDSPILLGSVYGEYNNLSYSSFLAGISLDYEKKYPAYNIYLKPENGVPFSSTGRYETVPGQLDNFIYEKCKWLLTDLHVYSCLDKHKILMEVERAIE